MFSISIFGLKEQLVNVLEKPIKNSGVDLLSPKKGFLNIIKNAGYPEIKFEKDVDFEKLYSENRLN